MRLPHHQPRRIGRMVCCHRSYLAAIWRMTRYEGLKLLACGKPPTLPCVWDVILLNSEDSVVRKPTVVDTPDGGAPHHAPGGAGWTKCPKVLEFFTAPKYDDGSPRRGGWMGLSAESGVWKVLLKEPSAGLMMRVEVKSLDLLWATMEVVLSEKNVPWSLDERAEVHTKKGKRKGT